MADLEDKNKNLSQDSAIAPAEAQKTQPETSTEKSLEEKRLQELHDNRFEKKGARRAFHGVNFLGLHQIFNNVTSVIITFTLATTGLATRMKDRMANGPVGKGLSTVLTAPSKAINFVFKVCGKDFDKNLTKIERDFITHEANRNAIETAFMTIAGFVALAPVYFLEKHRAGFLNTVDNWLHPGRTKEEKKAAALTPEDEPKETLWNLFRARIIALAAVFAVDQIRTNIDRILRDKHKLSGKTTMYKNVESVAGWRFGDLIYTHIGEKPRNWIARFFSGSLDILPEGIRGWFKKIGNGNLQENNLLLHKIQDETRGDVLKITRAPDFVHEASEEIKVIKDRMLQNPANEEALKKDILAVEKRVKATPGGLQAVERAVFAEQSRLFWVKEFALTTILSIIIYYCAKSETAAKFFEKVGLAKKGTYEKEHAKLEARRHAKHAPAQTAAPEADAAAPEKTWSAREEKRDVKKATAPAASFAEAAMNVQDQEVAASL